MAPASKRRSTSIEIRRSRLASARPPKKGVATKNAFRSGELTTISQIYSCNRNLAAPYRRTLDAIIAVGTSTRRSPQSSADAAHRYRRDRRMRMLLSRLALRPLGCGSTFARSPIRAPITEGLSLTAPPPAGTHRWVQQVGGPLMNRFVLGSDLLPRRGRCRNASRGSSSIFAQGVTPCQRINLDFPL